FLLLIFFMVSSTFREQFGIDVALPDAKTAAVKEAGLHEITVNAEGAYFVGTDRVDEDGLRNVVTRLIADEPESRLVLRADERADFGKVVRVMDIVNEAGGAKLIIPTEMPGGSPAP
ncbi:MAG: biopolymer transporter ExbD, partial [bacterium]|nr:biopolymer transporter ExbD [bacterium]